MKIPKLLITSNLKILLIISNLKNLIGVFIYVQIRSNARNLRHTVMYAKNPARKESIKSTMAESLDQLEATELELSL